MSRLNKNTDSKYQKHTRRFSTSPDGSGISSFGTRYNGQREKGWQGWASDSLLEKITN